MEDEDILLLDKATKARKRAENRRQRLLRLKNADNTDVAFKEVSEFLRDAALAPERMKGVLAAMCDALIEQCDEDCAAAETKGEAARGRLRAILRKSL